MLNLYNAPAFTPGMNTSHTPEFPRVRMELPAPSHPLKSPITCTARALGAHTANEVPRSEEHTSELQSRFDLVCRLLLEKKKEREFIGPQLSQTHRAVKCCR